MKKISTLLLIVMLILTGCFYSEKTMTCSKITSNDEGYENVETVVISYKKNKVVKTTTTIVTEVDPNFIEFFYSLGNDFSKSLNEVEGINIIYSKIGTRKLQSITEIDYSKINHNDLKKALGDSYDDEGNNIYKMKDISLEAYKANFLSEYSCE